MRLSRLRIFLSKGISRSFGEISTLLDKTWSMLSKAAFRSAFVRKPLCYLSTALKRRSTSFFDVFLAPSVTSSENYRMFNLPSPVVFTVSKSLSTLIPFYLMSLSTSAASILESSALTSSITSVPLLSMSITLKRSVKSSSVRSGIFDLNPVTKSFGPIS